MKRASRACEICSIRKTEFLDWRRRRNDRYACESVLGPHPSGDGSIKYRPPGTLRPSGPHHGEKSKLLLVRWKPRQVEDILSTNLSRCNFIRQSQSRKVDNQSFVSVKRTSFWNERSRCQNSDVGTSFRNRSTCLSRYLWVE